MNEPPITDRTEIEREVARRHWFHTFELVPGIRTRGHYTPNPAWLFEQMGVSSDLGGKRCLDMGCSDGLYGFELARRGATVSCVDVYSPDFQNVEFINSFWKLPVSYQQSTIYEFHGGPFDVINCLGVFYHLQYPLLGLHRLNQLCRDVLIIESAVHKGRALELRFYPNDEFMKDPSNWFTPTENCLVAMLESAGFKAEKRVTTEKGRLLLRAKKVRDVQPAFDARQVHRANFGFDPY